MHPVWCLDSFISANRRRVALTPSKNTKHTPKNFFFPAAFLLSAYFFSFFLFFFQSCQNKVISTQKKKNLPKLNDFSFEIAIDHLDKDLSGNKKKKYRELISEMFGLFCHSGHINPRINSTWPSCQRGARQTADESSEILPGIKKTANICFRIS